jgi:hypothetical protein
MTDRAPSTLDQLERAEKYLATGISYDGSAEKQGPLVSELWAMLRDTVAESRRLEQARDAAVNDLRVSNDTGEMWANRTKELRAALTEAQQERERLREALKPFAIAAERWDTADTSAPVSHYCRDVETALCGKRWPPDNQVSGRLPMTTPDARAPEQYRKRPVVIRAAQIPFDFATSHGRTAANFWERDLPWFIEQGRVAGTPVLPMPDDIVIQTLEHKPGEGFHASPGDWLICGVKGEVYACKPDIFAATYEPVSRETP